MVQGRQSGPSTTNISGTLNLGTAQIQNINIQHTTLSKFTEVGLYFSILSQVTWYPMGNIALPASSGRVSKNYICLRYPQTDPHLFQRNNNTYFLYVFEEKNLFC